MSSRKGQTLIEVVVATMISAISATAVFSVVLSTNVSSIRTDKREAAAQLFKKAQETLKNYVSAVPAETLYVPNNGRWSADSSGGWALNTGTHDISSLLNYGMCPQLNPNNVTCSAGSAVCKFTYTVSSADCATGNVVGGSSITDCKRVVFTLWYQDN